MLSWICSCKVNTELCKHVQFCLHNSSSNWHVKHRQAMFCFFRVLSFPRQSAVVGRLRGQAQSTLFVFYLYDGVLCFSMFQHCSLTRFFQAGFFRFRHEAFWPKLLNDEEVAPPPSQVAQSSHELSQFVGKLPRSKY